MPAATSAIAKNVQRMSNDLELLKLWNDATTVARPIGQAWLAFIEAADAAKIADRIPGSVARAFETAYAAAAEQPAASPSKVTAKRTTAKKAANK